MANDAARARVEFAVAAKERHRQKFEAGKEQFMSASNSKLMDKAKKDHHIMVLKN